MLQLACEYDVPHVFQLIRQRIAWMDEQEIKSWNKTNYLARFPESYFF